MTTPHQILQHLFTVGDMVIVDDLNRGYIKAITNTENGKNYSVQLIISKNIEKILQNRIKLVVNRNLTVT